MRSSFYAVLYTLIASAGIYLLLSSQAPAQTGARCDSSVKLMSCRAEGSLNGKVITLRPNTPQCAIVEWEYAGMNNITTVIDGEERIEILQPKQSPVVVKSCTVIKDRFRETGQTSGIANTNGTPVAQRPECMRLRADADAANDTLADHSGYLHPIYPNERARCAAIRQYVRTTITLQQTALGKWSALYAQCSTDPVAEAKDIAGGNRALANTKATYQNFDSQCSSFGF